MNINEIIRSGNPYHGPIQTIVAQLGEIEWRFPFLTQALVFIVSCIVLILLITLYMTVGLIAQISAIFGHLMSQAQQDMQGKTTITKFNVHKASR